MSADGGRRGRPRDETRDAAIRAAVLDLLAEHGYTALTVEAVAARAGAGKATIYRRWPGKAELVASAVAGLDSHPLTVPDTGDLREDLAGFLSALAADLRGPLGTVTAAVVGALAGRPALAAAFRSGLWGRVEAAVDLILRRGAERGQVPEQAPRELARELVGAALVNRLVLTGQPTDQRFVEDLLDRALLPMLGSGSA